VTRAIKVLIVIASDRRRGAELEGVQLASELSSVGVVAEAVALAPSAGSSTLDVLLLGKKRLGLRTLRALRRRARSVDVVIAYGSTTLPACAISMLGLSTPFVYRSIGDPKAWVRGGWHRRRTGLLMRRARRVIALWPDAADSIRDRYDVSADRIDVIPNARSATDFHHADEVQRAAPRRALGLPVEALVVGCVGSISSEKRVHLAVDAVAGIADAVLLVVGDGPDRAAVEELAGEKLDDRVIFTGQLESVVEVYAAIDVLVLTSATEGMPGVMIEAAMSGVPVVAPDVGAVRWLFDSGVRGEPVSVDAAAQEYSDAIARTAELPRVDATGVLEACTWDKVVERWRSVLDPLVARDGRKVAA
jgi:glycosyltransferase involved in cell wall biosynthesis